MALFLFDVFPLQNMNIIMLKNIPIFKICFKSENNSVNLGQRVFCLIPKKKLVTKVLYYIRAYGNVNKK